MSFLRRWKLFWYKIRGYTIIQVPREEDIETITTFFGIPDEKIHKVIKLSDTNYGRLVTFEFDLSDPDGKKAFDCIKKLSTSGSDKDSLVLGENYVTFHCKDFEEAEALRAPWKQVL